MAPLIAATQHTPHTPQTWRVWVTDEDVHRARSAWVRARDDGAPADRVRDLLEEWERLSRTATLQSAGDPWSSATELRAVTHTATSRALRRAERPVPLRVAG